MLRLLLRNGFMCLRPGTNTVVRMLKETDIWYRIILKWILREWKGWGWDWINVGQDRNTYLVVVYMVMVMNLQFPQNAGYFLSTW